MKGLKIKMGNHRLKLENRKFILTFCIVILIFDVYILHLPSANAALISKPPTNLGLVGYWSMNEGTGTVAGDASGNQNRGILTNGPTWVDGKRGKALNFDGVNDYVTMGDKLKFTATQPLTISVWFKVSSFGSTNYLVSRTNLNTRVDYGLKVVNASTVSFFRDDSGSTCNGYTNWSVPTMATNQWHHLTVVIFTDATATAYFDGSLISNQSAPHNDYVSSSFEIGREKTDCTSSAVVFFNGSIDEVRIYNRALSAAEIQALYKSGAAKIVKPITFDNAVTAGSLSAGTLTSTAFTVAPNATYLYVGVAISAGNSVTSVTAGATGVEKALTKLDSVEGSMRTEYWYIVSPPTGSIKVTVNISGATEVVFGAASYKGVNTATPHGTLAKTANDSSTSISVTVTSAFGELVVDSFAANANGDGSPGASQTARWGASSGSNRVSRGSEKAGAASVSMIWTSGSGHHALIAVPLKPKRETKINSSQNSKLTNGLVGLWSFNGPDMSGVTAYDRSGQGNNGTLTNGPVPAIGKIGQALNFDGSNDFVNAGSATILDDLGPLTWSAWIFAKSAGGGGFGRIIEKQSGSCTTVLNGWSFCFNAANTIRFAVDYNTTDLIVQTSNVVQYNKWNYVAFTWDGSIDATNVHIYLNGSEVTSYPTRQNGGVARVTDAAQELVISSKVANRAFDGLIDEVRVYNRALNSDEIKRLYNMGR